MQHKNGIAVKDIIDKQKVLKILGAVKIECNCNYLKAKKFWGAKGLTHSKSCGKEQRDLLNQIIKKVKRL